MNNIKSNLFSFICQAFLSLLLVTASTGNTAGVVVTMDSSALTGGKTNSVNAPQSAGDTFYISPDGHDENTGTKEQPFATLERAKRALKNNRGNPVTIYLRAGYYPLTKSFVLEKEDVADDFPILISSFPGERAYIIGGQNISGFTAPDPRSEVYKKINPEVRENIVMIDLKREGISRFGNLSARGFGRPIQPAGLELYFNEKPMTLARWPNNDWTTIEKIPESLEGKGFSYNGNRPTNWLNAPDAWLHGYWKYDWADTYVRIAKIDTTIKTIETEAPYSNYPYTKGRRFYVLNLLEELDTPGEWYLDRDEGLLYFWPPSEIKKAKVFVSLLQAPLIQLKKMSTITFKDLTVEYTCGAGIEIIGGSDNIIESCTLRNIGTVAVSIGELASNLGGLIYQNTLYNGNAGHDNGVINCQIYATGEGGIILGGGDRTMLAPGNNFAVNNNIYDCSRWVRTYRAGIFMYGVGNTVRNNLIHDLPHTAVFFWGNEHLLEYNEIHHVCMETGDAGAFYNGRDWTQRGSIIRYNYFHHLHGVEGQSGFTDVMAVYLDDWASGTIVFGNIFYKAGRTVMIGGGRDNLVENNIIIDGSPAVHVDARGMGWAKYYFDGSDSTLFKRLACVSPDKSPYSEHYPQLSQILKDAPALPKGNKIIRNISSGSKWVEFYNDETEPLVYFQDNRTDVEKHFLLNTDDMIQIQYDSKMVPPGFIPIPFEKIGMKRDTNE
jgi:hypothetical protein